MELQAPLPPPPFFHFVFLSNGFWLLLKMLSDLFSCQMDSDFCSKCYQIFLALCHPVYCILALWAKKWYKIIILPWVLSCRIEVHPSSNHYRPCSRGNTWSDMRVLMLLKPVQQAYTVWQAEPDNLGQSVSLSHLALVKQQQGTTASLVERLRLHLGSGRSGVRITLATGFFRVDSYQWLKNWHSRGYPARRLTV